MKKLIAPIAALAFMFSAGIATADEAAGKITAVDAQTLVLEDGTTFTIGEGVSTEGLEPGTEVTVSYEEKDGQMVVTDVTAN
jgi:Cu/Ag efflux protein CusF